MTFQYSWIKDWQANACRGRLQVLGIEIVDFIDMIHRRVCPGSLEETGNPSHHRAPRKIDTHVPMTTLKYQYLQISTSKDPPYLPSY